MEWPCRQRFDFQCLLQAFSLVPVRVSLMASPCRKWNPSTPRASGSVARAVQTASCSHFVMPFLFIVRVEAHAHEVQRMAMLRLQREIASFLSSRCDDGRDGHSGHR